MVTPRENHAMAVLDGKLYAMGGFNDDEQFLSSVKRYDPAANSWEEVAPMGEERSRPGTAVLDGKLYAVGGYNDDGWLAQLGRAVQSRDECVGGGAAAMAKARDSHAVAVLDGKLYAVGGYLMGYLTSVERYDPATNAWEEVAHMAAARAIVGVVVLDGKLYAVGGDNDDDGYSARWSGTTRPPTRGRRWRRWRRRGPLLSRS